MKIIKKIASTVSVAIICIAMSATSAYAATLTQDNLEVNLSTDKNSYLLDESINATLSVTNNGDIDISNVTLEGIIPEGYQLSNKSKERSHEILKSGETITLDLLYSPNSERANGNSDNKTSSNIDETKNSNSDKVSSNNSDNSKKSTDNKRASSTTDTNPGTGDDGVTIILILLSGSFIIAIIASRRKHNYKAFSILLCFVLIGTFGSQLNVSATDVEIKSISITETVTVGNKAIDITATVKYDMKTENEARTEADEYYEANSEKLISIEDASTSSNVFTEEEAVKLMQDRGFTEYPLTYEFMMSGSYVEETEASLGSSEKHPMYQTFYVSESGDVWTIYIIGKTVVANPASYNLESTLGAQLLFAENDTLTSYDDAGNKFYITIPKKSAVILKVMHEVNSEQLNKLTGEEIDKI